MSNHEHDNKEPEHDAQDKALIAWHEQHLPPKITPDEVAAPVAAPVKTTGAADAGKSHTVFTAEQIKKAWEGPGH